MLTDVDTLVVLDVDTLELNVIVVEILLLALEYVEYTVVVGVLTLVEDDVETLVEILVLTDVDTLELNEVDVEVLVLALEYVE